MDLLFGLDWRELFVPDKPLLQVVVRGTVIYIVIFFLIESSITMTARVNLVSP